MARHEHERGQRGQRGSPELLTQRLTRLLRLLDAQAGDALGREHGLRIIDWRLLAELTTSSPLTVRAVAERLLISRSEASRGVAALIARGLARREDDPDDGRSALFFATKDGRALYARIMPERTKFMTQLMEAIPAKDRHVFDVTLDALTERLDADRSTGAGRLRTRRAPTGSDTARSDTAGSDTAGTDTAGRS